MIIYHYPGKLDPEAAVGSTLRPLRMLEAFRSLGEEVIEISGRGMARVGKADALDRALESDTVFYSESVNVPPGLTWARRRPWRMNFDYHLIRDLHRRGVPTGLFYRDIYWMLEETRAINLKSFVKKRLTPAFARRELRHYEKSLDVLFLPHRNMGQYVPFPFSNTEMRTLPPGGEQRDPDPGVERDSVGEGGCLNLLYVGNIAPPHYDLRPYIEAVETVSCAKLEVVTRERALEHHGHLYRFEERRNVTLSHAHGETLAPLYQRANLALAVRDDSEYLAFAMPVKIFEAISFGVPLVVSAGLRVVADLVEREKLGWVIDTPDEFRGLLQRLADDPAELARARARVGVARENHTWESRAREVVEALRAVRARRVT
ncbi:MAG: glycosyltransferase [Roseibacillus sp.]|nr:glycosyltransferase [Roseibacillus sp.]